METTLEFEVELISKQQIKPSSPTPHHLRHLQLSFLDEIQHRILLPFVLFYSKTPTISNLRLSSLLKTSLSKALTIFHPLAGRVKNNSHVDCNDEGALFVEAKANCCLSDVLTNKYSSNFQNHKFLPRQPDEADDLAACFQVTFFSCGGYAISIAMSHKLGDGMSVFLFLNSWASIARGDKVDVPTFGSAHLFPPKKLPEIDPVVHKEKTVIRVFVFEAATISALRTKYTLNGKKLTRVQALAAFLWSRFMAVAQAKSVNTQYMMIHAVNLRPKMMLPMPEMSFGNLCRIAVAVPDKVDVKKDTYCYETAKKMKDAIENVNFDFVEKLQKSDTHLKFLKEKGNEVARGDVVTYSFTSLCGFPIYQVDFGLGKPEWVASGGLLFKNLVLFLEAKEEGAIEAWISLKEEEMAKFESDDELLSHVSSTSSPNEYFQSLIFDAQSRL